MISPKLHDKTLPERAEIARHTKNITNGTDNSNKTNVAK